MNKVINQFEKILSFPVAWSLIYILIAMAVVVINLGQQVPFGEDYGLNYYFPDIWTHLSANMWDDLTGTGKITITSTMTLLWSQFVYGLQNLGMDEYGITRTVYFLFYFISLYSVFSLCKNIFKYHLRSVNLTHVNISAFIAGLVYTFSPYVLGMTHHPIYSYHFIIPLYPLLFSMIIVTVHNEYEFKRVFLISLLVCIMAVGNPSHLILVMIYILMYLLYFKRNFVLTGKEIFKSIVVSCILVALLSSYIWLPMFGHMITADISNPYDGGSAIDNFWASILHNSRRGEMLNVILGLAYPWYDSFSYYDSYVKNVFVVCANLVLIIFTFSIFIYKTKSKRIVVFFFLSALISMFLAKGLQPPLLDVFKFIYKEVPGFSIFRAVYHKFGLILNISYAVLASLSMYYLMVRLKSAKTKLLSAAFITCLIAINGFPMLTGEAIDEQYISKLPNEYKSIRAKYNDNDEITKVLCLPATPRKAGSVLVWEDGYYIGPHIAFYIFNKPYIDAAYFIEKKIWGMHSRDWWEEFGLVNNMDKLIDHSRYYAIDTIYVDKKVPDKYRFTGAHYDLTLNGQKKYKMIMNKLDKMENIRKVDDNEYFALYKISRSITKPLIYSPENINLRVI